MYKLGDIVVVSDFNNALGTVDEINNGSSYRYTVNSSDNRRIYCQERHLRLATDMEKVLYA